MSIGIDVQAELALKGSPHLRPTRPPMASQATPMQKAMLNRQQGRQRPILAPPLQTVNQTSHAGGQRNFGGSPAVQPTPPSQHSSPSTTKSPAFAIQGGMASPNSDFQPQQGQQSHQPRLLPGSRHQQYGSQPQSHMRSISASASSQQPPGSRPSSQAAGGSYYPQFPKHYDQLGKFTHTLPSPACHGALFVLGLFREYRAGVRCTSWYARRSRRRRHRHRQFHPQLPASNHERWSRWSAGVAANDHRVRKRHNRSWRRRRPCH